jgi:Tfp pilus assembly protein PilP
MTTQPRPMMAMNRWRSPHDAAGRAPGRRGPSGLVRAAAVMLAVGLAVGLVTGLAAGCGDSGDTSSAPMVTPVTPQQNRPAAAPGATPEQGLRFHAKIDDVIGEEQAQRIRHKFTVDDFGPDVSGSGRRDPFRSLAIAKLAEQSEGPKIDPAQACKDVVAEQFVVRDLRLVGIVLRGSRSYALFVDKASKGHIVTKGDCIGLEKARVLSVRAGFVTLQITPDAAAQGTTPAELQERTIALYPDEIPVEGEMQ